MSDYCELENFCPPKNGCAVALGFFDGVHQGHQRILDRALHLAEDSALQSRLLPVVYTFVNHPARVLHPHSRLELLSTPAERWRRIGNLGLQCIAEEFTASVAEQDPFLFWQRVIVERLHAKAIVCGPNYSFGCGASGTPRMLREWGRELGVRVCVEALAEYDGQIISSSRLREAVRSGRMEEARAMLGRPFEITGTVVSGSRLGRRWGFPTANLEWPQEKVRLPWGAYACRAVLPDGGVYPAVGYVGSRPTVNEDADSMRLEVNIGALRGGIPVWRSDCFENDGGGEFHLYGAELTVLFEKYLAPQERFAGMAQLRERIQKYRQMTGELWQADEPTLV